MLPLRVLTLCAALVLSSCAPNDKSVVSNAIPLIQGTDFAQRDLAVPSPETATVIVYSHGTSNPRRREDCSRSFNQVPGTLAEIDGGSVHVFRHCSHAFEQPGRQNAGKQVYARMRELTSLLDGFAEAGVDSDRIILAGHSNGGWTSLMVHAAAPGSVAGVIAFAPAFAGPRSEINQYPWWRKELRPRQVREMTSGGPINALIFAYDRDRFNRPQELAFLPQAFPDTVSLQGYDCADVRAHTTHLTDCRAAQTQAAILAFLDQRIGK